MTRLCRLEEIEDGESKGFVLGEGKDRLDLFLVREGTQVYGYLNSCPHLGSPLEFTEDRFLTADGAYILCSTHGALFEITDGRCIAGPCQGAHLTPIKVALDETGYLSIRP